MSHTALNYYETDLHRLDSQYFTMIKPFIPQEVAHLADSFQNSVQLRGEGLKKNWLSRKIFNEDLIRVKGKDFAFFVNPLFNFTLGKDNTWDTASPLINTRGFRLNGHIGGKFNFESEFYENQTLYPKYVHDDIRLKNRIPGVGGLKAFVNPIKEDFAYVLGGVSYQPSKYFHFRFGQGKHFWGDGYRSLLLSDNAAAYPYFQITTTFWKIRYINLWAQLLDINRITPDGSFTRKYIATHLLSYNITKRLNISLFETVVYHDTVGTRGLDLNYLNPIIFYRPLEFQLNSSAGNVLLGGNLKFKLTNNQLIYGQFILDEFNFQELRKKQGWWANKFAYQIGFKSFNTFIKNLTLQSEINMVRPYTYSHTLTFQNYGHYNQPLAHTLGSNFRESVSTFRYFHKRLFTEGRLIFITQGLDSTANTRSFGSDIYKSNERRISEYGVELLQGIKAKTTFADFKIGYLVNPRTNLRLETGVTIRRFNPEKEIFSLKRVTTKYFYIGLRSDLNNYYYDF
jgi:hypothetical protein